MKEKREIERMYAIHTMMQYTSLHDFTLDEMIVLSNTQLEQLLDATLPEDSNYKFEVIDTKF